jgi:manganese/zinc/iron transport system ATP- binding protein
LKWYRNRDREAALFALKQFQLEHLANRQISELSGGQQQRLFLARAFLQEPEVFFLDEPFAGVDQVTEKALVAKLRQLKEEGKTILVVHHDLNTVTDYFDLALILKVSAVAYGSAQSVLTEHHMQRAFDRTDTLLYEAQALAKKEKMGL